ncbi:MAG: RsmB/NOP family class I SAM-dependent RNA methyltransferase [Parachlamydiales bacterium]|nr:RsmB/NOP family class I SAM-dependent RNA methyltransferase [Parachlamydiales bacterium]
MIPFRQHHLIQLLQEFDPQKGPLDLFMSLYFRENRALGSKDKAFISEAVYKLIRHQTLVDYLSDFSDDWLERLDVLEEWLQNPDASLPLHLQLSFPEDLFIRLVKQYGQDQAKAICIASNLPAPTTIRVNTLKISRDELFEKWKNNYDVSLCHYSDCGIVFNQKVHFYSMPEFQNGFFEMQDEASQLVALHVKARPTDLVLDYCAGSGGKTLAFAPLMHQKGQIFLHDIRPHILLEAKRRLKRAGIQNAQLLLPDNTAKQKKLKKKMDWVLVDAPCSGSGTWRRNPDMKGKFHEERLQSLIKEQRVIFERALSFVKPGGHIVYATCSLFAEENENQADFFKKNYNLTCQIPYFFTIPKEKEMDGFFCAVFKKSGN